MISFKGRHHQRDIILQCVRWYVAYSLSYRDLEELMEERGYVVDHSTIQCWVKAEKGEPTTACALVDNSGCAGPTQAEACG